MLGFNIPAAAVELPDFLDPLLSYLSDTLPPPVYSFLIDALSHSLALLTALSTIISSLISTNWNAQAILPPLISLFAAYLALLSLYRTTSWIFRTTIWFIKWGAMIGVLAAGVGWIMGSGNGLGNHGVVSAIGGFVLDQVQGNAAGKSHPKSKKARTRSSPSLNKRKAKSWESFERHQDRRNQDNGPIDQSNDAQKIIGGIVDAAGRVVRESGWWGLAKSFVEGDPSGRDVREAATEGKQAPKKSKAKDGSSRSR